MVNAKMGLYDSFAVLYSLNRKKEMRRRKEVGVGGELLKRRTKGEMYRGKIYNFNGGDGDCRREEMG